MSQELAAQNWVKNESSEQSAVPLSSEGGAPLRRGPRGLFSRFGAFVAAPEVKVWGRPLLRVTGMMGVLGCVAFLGKQSEEESMHGARVAMPSLKAEVRVPDSEEHPAVAPEGQVAPGLAQTAPQSAAPPPCSEEKAASGSTGILPDGRIIMNEATQTDFTRLSGIGDARAAKIIELRTRMGKFKQVADLLRVRGIGWKTLQSMKDQLVVDRPVETTKPEPEKESGKNGEQPATDDRVSKPASS